MADQGEDKISPPGVAEDLRIRLNKLPLFRIIDELIDEFVPWLLLSPFCFEQQLAAR